jgi:Nicotinic acid mononucleotide adenylyltransferase
MKKKIGLFGGTFNPPHMGHTNAAMKFYEYSDLSLLYVMPACIPPHKELSPFDSPTNRFCMTSYAFSAEHFPNKNITVSDFELKSNEINYTIETVNYLLRRHTVAQIYVYVGSDMFFSLENWKSPKELFEKCIFITAPRDKESIGALQEYKQRFEQDYNARCCIMEIEPVIVTSTFLRDLFSDKSDNLSFSATKKYLTEDVYRYIIDKKLYQSQEG